MINRVQRDITFSKARLEKEKNKKDGVPFMIKMYEEAHEDDIRKKCRYEKKLAELYVADGRDYTGSSECGSSRNADGSPPGTGTGPTPPAEPTPPAGPTPEEVQADDSRQKLADARKKYKEL